MTDSTKCLICGPTFIGTCPHRSDLNSARFLCPAHSDLTMREYVELTACFKCIHDEYRALDEEVRRLQAALELALNRVTKTMGYWNESKTDNKRLREALEALCDDWDEFAVEASEWICEHPDIRKRQQLHEKARLALKETR